MKYKFNNLLEDHVPMSCSSTTFREPSPGPHQSSALEPTKALSMPPDPARALPPDPARALPPDPARALPSNPLEKLKLQSPLPSAEDNVQV